MRTLLTAVLLAGAIGCSTPTSADDKSSTAALEAKAVSAAERWMKPVDAGNYAGAWTRAAAMLRDAISQDAFAQALGAARAPLGKVVSRKLKSKTFATELPGAPDGKYVVIQFTTRFANKKNATETITPMLEADGKWRVSGYYIK